MKFLCLDCDAPMRLAGTEGPDAGSLAVTFRCPTCGFRVAMLTNPFETQMVRSLGVAIGGASPAAAGPLGYVRGALGVAREDAVTPGAGAAAPDPAAGGAGCPFAAMLGESGEAAAPAAAAGTGRQLGDLAGRQLGDLAGRQLGDLAGPAIAWTGEAEARVERIPAFIRPMARRAIERLCEAKGYPLVTEAVMDEARGAFGM